MYKEMGIYEKSVNSLYFLLPPVRNISAFNSCTQTNIFEIKIFFNVKNLDYPFFFLNPSLSPTSKLPQESNIQKFKILTNSNTPIKINKWGYIF